MMHSVQIYELVNQGEIDIATDYCDSNDLLLPYILPKEYIIEMVTGDARSYANNHCYRSSYRLSLDRFSSSSAQDSSVYIIRAMSISGSKISSFGIYSMRSEC